MRTCQHCGASLEGRRRHAIYCGGPCRAAASRAKAAESREPDAPVVEQRHHVECAQKRTSCATDIIQWGQLSAADQDRIERIMRDHADLAGETA